MSETAEEMEARLRQMGDDEAGDETWDLSPNDKDAIRYALRAIEERRDLLAALRDACDAVSDCKDWQALIAKCEAP